MDDNRIEPRRDFSYYVQLTDASTSELIGGFVDISSCGFKLDSDKPIPIEQEYHFHLALTPNVAQKPYMIFKARSKWCQVDPINPFVYNAGFHLSEIRSEDRSIFNRVLQLYGSKKSKKRFIPPRDSY